LDLERAISHWLAAAGPPLQGARQLIAALQLLDKPPRNRQPALSELPAGRRVKRDLTLGLESLVNNEGERVWPGWLLLFIMPPVCLALNLLETANVFRHAWWAVQPPKD